jgi:glutamate formiminotransferase
LTILFGGEEKMAIIIESVPNFSEGQNQATIATLASIAANNGAALLNHSMDSDHNRSVFTLAGEASPLVATLLKMLEYAIGRIDMNMQRGVHPRIGAMDVVPFIPMGNADFSHCIDCARTFADRAQAELGMPAFFYGELVGTFGTKKQLPEVRGKGYEDLPRRLATGEIELDAGQALHPTAGVMAVGVRDFLIAYNVNLATENLTVAQEIATLIREKDGGLPGVRALGLALPSQKMVQVSINIVDSRRTSIYTVFKKIEDLARIRGVQIAQSEFIGMIPAFAAEASLQEALSAPTAPILESKVLALM